MGNDWDAGYEARRDGTDLRDAGLGGPWEAYVGQASLAAVSDSPPDDAPSAEVRRTVDSCRTERAMPPVRPTDERLARPQPPNAQLMASARTLIRRLSGPSWREDLANCPACGFATCRCQ